MKLEIKKRAAYTEAESQVPEGAVQDRMSLGCLNGSYLRTLED